MRAPLRSRTGSATTTARQCYDQTVTANNVMKHEPNCSLLYVSEELRAWPSHYLLLTHSRAIQQGEQAYKGKARR